MGIRETAASPVVIRQAAPADFAAISALTLAGFRDGPYGHIPPSAERIALVEDAAGRAAAGELLVAEVDAVIVGTANLLRAGSPYGRLGRPGEAELRLLTVASAARGRGIAEALVNASIESAAEWGVDQLVLDTGDQNFAAQRLYERMNFSRDPQREQELAASSSDGIGSFVYTKRVQ